MKGVFTWAFPPDMREDTSRLQIYLTEPQGIIKKWNLLLLKKSGSFPPDLQEEAMHFIDFLLTKKSSKQEKRPNLKWIGGLKAYRDQYTALELQKKAKEPAELLR